MSAHLNNKELRVIDESSDDPLVFENQLLTDHIRPISMEVISFHQPTHRYAENIRRLRNQLKFQWLEQSPDHKSVAIVSPESGEGRSYLTANLAVSFCSLGLKTLVIDTDVNNPRQHALFGLSNQTGLSVIESDHGCELPIQKVPTVTNLHVLTAGFVSSAFEEALTHQRFADCLSNMKRHFEIVLLDTSPASLSSSALSVAKRAGAALQLVRKDFTHRNALHEMTENFKAVNVPVVGTIWNEF